MFVIPVVFYSSDSWLIPSRIFSKVHDFYVNFVFNFILLGIYSPFDEFRNGVLVLFVLDYE